MSRTTTNLASVTVTQWLRPHQHTPRGHRRTSHQINEIRGQIALDFGAYVERKYMGTKTKLGTITPHRASWPRLTSKHRQTMTTVRESKTGLQPHLHPPQQHHQIPKKTRANMTKTKTLSAILMRRPTKLMQFSRLNSIQNHQSSSQHRCTSSLSSKRPNIPTHPL